MAVFRVYKESGNFVTVHKGFIHDENISLKAKGILLYLLSRPDDWQIYEAELAKHCTDGLSSLKSGIKELEEQGYIKRERKRNEKGHLKSYEYTVYEQPNHMRLSNVGKSNVGKTNVGDSNIGKPHITNNNNTNNDLTNNNNSNNDNTSHHHLYSTNNIYSDPTTLNQGGGSGSNPYQFFQENGFGHINSYIAEDMSMWITDFKEYGNDMVIEAMKIAIDNKKNTWSYTKSILKRWINERIMTPKDIQADEKARESHKKQPKIVGPDGLTPEERAELRKDPTWWD
ncbi:DnaD domain protein [Staphylococcus pseudintermedius]|nr:DnaD domain protein [Staphylococcus pseudintermedius]